METKQGKKWMAEAKLNPALMRRNTMLAFRYFMEEWSEGNIDIPGIIPWATFRKSSLDAFRQIQENTGKGETIGVFTSGGTISSIVGQVIGIQTEAKVANLNYSIRNSSFFRSIPFKERV